MQATTFASPPAPRRHSPSRGRPAGGRGKCDCCPYGYHLELDFVRYCEKVAASGLLKTPGRKSTNQRPTRKRRESRESLLGIRTKGAEFEARSHSDDLERAVLDFERMLDSSTRPQLEESYNLSIRQPTKYATISDNRSGDSSDDWKQTGPNNDIRHQMATSLNRMRRLEEEVKIIPNLQNQLKKLQWENRRLIKLSEATERKQEENKINISAVEGKEIAVHKRTIGTGCSVLQRTVGTSYYIPSKNIGTDSPKLDSIPCVHVAVQATSRKAFTLDFGCQTDFPINTLPLINNKSEQKRETVGCQRDNSVMLRVQPVGCHYDLMPKNRNLSVGCQYEPLSTEYLTDNYQCYFQSKTSVRDIGVQIDMNKSKRLNPSIGIQSDFSSLKIMSFKDNNSQTDEKPFSRKKEVGTQNKPQSSHIGIIAKAKVISNSTQTTIVQNDVGTTVNTLNESIPKRSIGTDMAEEVIPNNKTLSLISRLNEKCNQFSTLNAAINTEKIILVNSATQTSSSGKLVKRVDSNKQYHITPPTAYIQEKQITSSTPVRASQEESLSHNEKVRLYEELQAKSTPPKPYKKKEPSREMKGAMKVLNDNLIKSPSSEIPKIMRNAVNIVQQEWFKISSTADANPLDVEDYIDCFEELSVSLLEYIVNMTDVSGNTAMHYAVSNGNFDVVSILLDSKVCNINKLNTAGYTCIMLVALTKVKSETDRQVVRRLFQMADVNIRAKQHGQTALMLAVSHGRIDTVELLLESDADINIQDEDGSTALMCAAEHGYIDIVKLLLAQPDCDLSVTDLDGNTALNIAMEAGNRDIGVLLYAQEHFSRGASPFSTLKIRRAKSVTPTLRTRTPTPTNSSQEHSLFN